MEPGANVELARVPFLFEEPGHNRVHSASSRNKLENQSINAEVSMMVGMS